MALRTCIDCGLEAHSEGDLLSFKKGFRPKHGSSKHGCSKYGRFNLCKECYNKRRRLRRRSNDRTNLNERLGHMTARCYNPNNISYTYYGERGITICQEWLDNPDTFIEWSLANGFQRELQIDRIDNDGSYSPENCRWVTPQTQARHRRNAVTDFEV